MHSLRTAVSKVIAVGAILGTLVSASAQEQRPVVNLARAMGLEFGPETTVIEGPVGADGLPDYLEATNRKLSAGVAPGENFWALAWPAMGNVERSSPEYLAAASRWLQVAIPRESRLHDIAAVNGVPERVAAAGPYYDEMQKTVERPWKRSEHPAVVRWIEANGMVLSQMTEAARRPKAFAPLISESQPAVACVMLPFAQCSRPVARVLISRAMLRIEEGDFDGAWADLTTVLRFARHLESGPTLVEHLIGAAVRTMAQEGLAHWLSRTDASGEALEARWKELAPLLEVPPFVEAIDWERYSYTDTAIALAAGKFPPQELDAGVPHLSLVAGETWMEQFNGELLRRTETAVTRFLIASADINVTLRYGNRVHDDLVAAMRPATHMERKRTLSAILAQVQADRAESSEPKAFLADLLLAPPGSPSLMPGKALVGSLLPSLIHCERSYTSAVARSRTLEAAFRFMIAARRTGALPTSLADLIQEDGARLSDPFDDQPLRMNSDERGIVIWSVGPNGKDDGGQNSDERPRTDDLRTILVLP